MSETTISTETTVLAESLGVKACLGTELQAHVQKEALSRFRDRFTGEHTPAWAHGFSFPVRFVNDRDWLEHTYFYVRSDGELDRRHKGWFASFPTWP